MKKILIILGIAVICGVGVYIFVIHKEKPEVSRIAIEEKGEEPTPTPFKSNKYPVGIEELRGKAIEVVKEGLESENSANRQIAMESISGYRDKGEIIHLRELLKREDNKEKRIAAIGLARLGDDNGKEILLMDYRRWKEGREDEKGGISIDTAEALAELGMEEGFEVFEAIIKSDAWGPKISVAEKLGGIDHPRSRELLRELLGNSSPAIRVTAAKSLARLGDSSVRGILEENYVSKDTAVKWRAAIGLAYLGDETPRGLFEEGIRSDDVYAQIESAKGLLLLGDTSAGGLIKQALNSDDEYLRLYAAKALSELKK